MLTLIISRLSSVRVIVYNVLYYYLFKLYWQTASVDQEIVPEILLLLISRNPLAVWLMLPEVTAWSCIVILLQDTSSCSVIAVDPGTVIIMSLDPEELNLIEILNTISWHDSVPEYVPVISSIQLSSEQEAIEIRNVKQKIKLNIRLRLIFEVNKF